MERDPIQLPARLARLVQRSNAEDLTREIEGLLASGRRQLTVGLGPGVDVPLLDRQLYAAEIESLGRQLVVATLRTEPDGFLVERGWSNFGVYTWAESDPGWNSVPYSGLIRGLRPGDRIALGSTPADSLTFMLPRAPGVPDPSGRSRALPPMAPSHLRGEQPPGELDQSLSHSSPPSLSRGTRTSSARSHRRAPAAPRQLLPAQRTRFQSIFDHAIRHWRYEIMTFGTRNDNVIVTDDPELDGLRVALRRSLTNPERGYELFVRDSGPELWVKARGAAVRYLYEGDSAKLTGLGHRIGFYGYVVELPAPAAPVPKFTPSRPPTVEEISVTLDIPEDRLHEHKLVRARYAAYSLVFQPDSGRRPDPGHESRLLELKVCFQTWEELFPET